MPQYNIYTYTISQYTEKDFVESKLHQISNLFTQKSLAKYAQLVQSKTLHLISSSTLLFPFTLNGI